MQERASGKRRARPQRARRPGRAGGLAGAAGEASGGGRQGLPGGADREEPSAGVGRQVQSLQQEDLCTQETPTPLSLLEYPVDGGATELYRVEESDTPEASTLGEGCGCVETKN